MADKEKGRSALGDAMKVTKCVTIHTFKPDVLPTSSEKWVNCFSLAPSAQQALNTKSELESANLSHMLLRINVPNQQAYHLPMLITPAFCVYLITFDLRIQKESLSKIHNAMKDVYTLSTYRSEAGDTDLPKVLLVGMYADEAKDKGLFAQKLNTRLEKMPYDRLVERPVGDEPFWAVDGGNLSLSGSDALSQQVQSYHSRHKVEVHRWIVHLCELEEKLQEKLQRAPYMCYSELKEEVDTSNFDACLHFLHNYGFIFYHSVKVEEAVGEGRAGQGRQGADEVVVLQPQYLCNLFAKVQEFSATKKRLTVADLLSRTGASTEATAEHRQWFQRICIDMGLVVAVRLDYIFLMGLKGGIPSCPPREEYSVPPLLMTFRDSKHFTVEPEYLLPSYFFAVFVTEFLRILAQQSGPQPQALVMEQHYMEVKKGTTAIHIVERDFCIEIGLQQLDVGKLAPEKKKTNLNTTCKDIKKVVVESAENIATRLKLASSNIRYGCYHTCETEEGPLDSFGEFCPQSTELGGPYLECFCCDGGVQPTTPLQRIWFLEDFPLGEVSVQTITAPPGSRKKICKLQLLPQVLAELQQADLITSEECEGMYDSSDVVRVQSGKSPEVQSKTADVLRRHGFEKESTLLSGTTEPDGNVDPPAVRQSHGSVPGPERQSDVLSQEVTGRPGYPKLFRIHVSRKAAGKARAVLEGVELDTATIAACISAQNEEEAVQEGLIKWCGGKGRQPPTWGVLVEAMQYAQIDQQDVQGLKEELGL